MKGLIFFALILGSIYSCQRKTHLSIEDLEWVAPYNIGQEVIFESTDGLRDTILILDKSVQYSVKVFSDVYQHNSAYVSYYNRKFPKHMEYQNMLAMYKFEPNKPARFFFWFLLEGIDVSDYEMIPMQNISYDGKIINTYKLNTFRSKSQGGNTPKLVYWDMELGVIRYITHNDIEWNLIEIKEANEKDWDKQVWSKIGNIDYGQ